MEKEEMIKKIMNCCFADDSIYKSEIKKYDRSKDIFWKNFRDWEKNSGGNDFSGIYNSKRYDTLRDPDSLSQNLYNMHERIWNEQCEKFNIPKVSPNKDCELKINEKDIYLGSDSIMSIYWHWKRMQQRLKEFADYLDENGNLMDNEIKRMEGEIGKSRQEKCFYDENWDKIKRFIWLYLQKSNTIGGFTVFPRHETPTVNTKRGSSTKICDRFDLTLECIRRAYQEDDFYRDDINPLFGIPEEDKSFFRMFGGKENGFKNYVDFFLLNSWIKEDEEHHYHVKNLLHDDKKEDKERNIQTLDNWNFNQNPLPQAEEWWIFYRNIMDRLEVRNKQIEKLLKEEKCSENDLQKLYSSLDLEKD